MTEPTPSQWSLLPEEPEDVQAPDPLALALAERRGYWRAVVAIAAKNARMALQLNNVARLSTAERTAVEQRAEAIRRGRVGTAILT